MYYLAVNRNKISNGEFLDSLLALFLLQRFCYNTVLIILSLRSIVFENLIDLSTNVYAVAIGFLSKYYEIQELVLN